MKETLKNIVIGATVVGALTLTGCNKCQKVIDQVPSYGMALKQTTLTDIDRNGSWNIADVVEAGYTTGSVHRTLYFERGFGPAQSVDADVKFVDASFFEQYKK